MIVDPVVMLAFIPAALALNLTPGADMMFCLGQGLRGGPRAALAADAGIAVGGMVHVLVAGLGLGALVARAPWLFEVIRWVGVAYLLWLAVQALRAGPVGAVNGRAQFVAGVPGRSAGEPDKSEGHPVRAGLRAAVRRCRAPRVAAVPGVRSDPVARGAGGERPRRGRRWRHRPADGAQPRFRPVAGPGLGRRLCRAGGAPRGHAEGVAR